MRRRGAATSNRRSPHVSFGEFAAGARVGTRSSRLCSGGKGQAAGSRAVRGAVGDAAVAAAAPLRGARRAVPGEEPGMRMKVDEEGAGVLTNCGEGNCLYHALAQCDLGGASRTHRQLRRYANVRPCNP